MLYLSLDFHCLTKHLNLVGMFYYAFTDFHRTHSFYILVIFLRVFRSWYLGFHLSSKAVCWLIWIRFFLLKSDISKSLSTPQLIYECPLVYLSSYPLYIQCLLTMLFMLGSNVGDTKVKNSCYTQRGRHKTTTTTTTKQKTDGKKKERKTKIFLGSWIFVFLR